jgi:CubicO group peptidase (beta-lactamase class C family)
MVTAMTVLKLDEQGKLALSDKIATRIASGQANSDSWAQDTPIRNLLTHTSGVKDDLCTADDSALTVNCQSFFNAPHAPTIRAIQTIERRLQVREERQMELHPFIQQLQHYRGAEGDRKGRQHAGVPRGHFKGHRSIDLQAVG